MPKRTRQHPYHKIEIGDEWTDNYKTLFRGDVNPWSDRKVLVVWPNSDFTPAILLNTAFETFATGFSRNIHMSAKEPSMPTPSTLMFRYLFTPNLQKHKKQIRDELERFEEEVRMRCTDSSYYGLHLRLRLSFATDGVPVSWQTVSIYRTDMLLHR